MPRLARFCGRASCSGSARWKFATRAPARGARSVRPSAATALSCCTDPFSAAIWISSTTRRCVGSTTPNAQTSSGLRRERRHVIPFDHNVRSATAYKAKKQSKGGQRVGRPEHITPRRDYTLLSAPERLRMLAEPPSATDTMREFVEPGQGLLEPELVDRGLAPDGRFAIVNVWRNIAHEPVAVPPARVVRRRRPSDPEDLVVFELHYPRSSGARTTSPSTHLAIAGTTTPR